MRTTIGPAFPSDFAGVYEGVLRELNPSIPRKRWQNLFEWPWENPEDHVGYLMRDAAGAVVGFAGFIYSRQASRQGPELVCNITSWMVKTDYKAGALALVMPVLSRKDLTVTNLTSIPAVAAIFTRLGFEVLETHTRVLLPVRAWLPGRYRVRSGAEAGSRLDPTFRRLQGDHRCLATPLLAEGPAGACHIIFGRGRTRGVATARIHHISDSGVFADALPAIQRRLLVGHGLPLIECDERLLGDAEIPFTRRVQLKVHRLFRSDVFRPGEVSNLYSEMVLLDL